jgi:N6-adenosine-specific RNA methylase IME4
MTEASPLIFRTVSIDFPWPERGGGKIKRGADRHYPLMEVEQGYELLRDTCEPLRRIADNAHMWMWVTDNYLREPSKSKKKDAFWLMEALGFTYKRTFQWVKVQGKPRTLDFDTGHAVELTGDDVSLRTGIGQYGRGAHETLLFGVRGKGQHPDVFQPHRDVPSVLLAPHAIDENGKRIHSRKPDASYELIERRSKGPYLELFARRQWSSEWTCWGNEAPT